LTKYETAKTKIHIKCKKCGHKFWQEAFSHLSGCGCPSCNESKLEKRVTQYLDERNINHEKQKKFEWLGKQSLYFYLPDYNIVI
jgi:Zn finger protein HypA/HybF involved in hydrogenase expression